MKNILLLIALFAALSSQSQTNLYHPFPDSNAVWNINYYWACMGSEPNNDLFSLTYSGDTIIGSTSYHKLNTPFIDHQSVGTCGGGTTGYQGAIRHDGPGKRVYFVPPSSGNEQLLYDFNLQVGDTVEGYLETNAWPADVVQEIDSVLVGNTYRKRWIINTCYNISLIEGIGSTYGLIQPSPGCVTDLPDYAITCFRQNGETLFPDTVSNCELITAIPAVHPVPDGLIIRPNPCHGSFSIDFGTLVTKTEIRLTDISGKLVLVEQVDGRQQVSVENLRSGVYILSVISGGKNLLNRKIVNLP